MVTQSTVRTYGINQVFRFVIGIWLHRQIRQIRVKIKTISLNYYNINMINIQVLAYTEDDKIFLYYDVIVIDRNTFIAKINFVYINCPDFSNKCISIYCYCEILVFISGFSIFFNLLL